MRISFVSFRGRIITINNSIFRVRSARETDDRKSRKSRKMDGHFRPGTNYFCVSAPVFPDLIRIDEEIRVLRLTLKSPDLSPRYIRGYKVLLDDCLNKRRKLLEGIKKRL